MKKFRAKVISTKMQKTVVVERMIQSVHPLYKKILHRHRHLKARNDLPLSVGDQVVIGETRPLSKDVHFKVLEKVSGK